MVWIALAFAVFSAAYAPCLRADEPYFPEGVFDREDKEANQANVAWYTKYLPEPMGEPSLWKLSKVDHAVTVYRLLWIPSFHPPVSVRIVKSGKSIVLHAVKLEGTGSEEPAKISVRQTKELTEDEWTWLQVYLARSQYWKMSTSVKMDLDTGFILDGDHLICEGVEDGKYHIVDRLEPDPNYVKLCRFMLELSRLDVKEAWAFYHEEDRDKKPSR